MDGDGDRARAALEAAILANRDDADAYLVYADWLTEHGDPRGALIVGDHRIETTPDPEARRALLRATEERDLPFVEGIEAWRDDFEWRWGFIDRLALDRPSPEDLDRILSHPSARFMRELEVDAPYEASPALLGAIAARPRHLQALVFRQGYVEHDDSVLEPQDLLWRQLPDLRRLTIHGFDLFNGISHAGLREVSIRGYPIDGYDWTLPALESLVWRLEEDRTDTVGGWYPWAVRAVWDGHFPALRRLELTGSFMADVDHRPGLFSYPELLALIRRLEVLRVSLSALASSEDLARAVLRRHADDLAHLRELVAE